MGIFDALTDRLNTDRQNALSKRAYKHRYQWQMEDMRKAGLNPILGSMRGAGAAPSMAQTPKSNVEGTITNVLAAKRLQAELREIKSREQLNTYLGAKAVQDTRHSAAGTNTQHLQNIMTALQIPGATNAASIESEYGPAKQKTEWIFERLGGFLMPFLGGAAGGRLGSRRNPQRGPPPRRGRDAFGPQPKKGPYVGPRMKKAKTKGVNR